MDDVVDQSPKTSDPVQLSEMTCIENTFDIPFAIGIGNESIEQVLKHGKGDIGKNSKTNGDTHVEEKDNAKHFCFKDKIIKKVSAFSNSLLQFYCNCLEINNLNMSPYPCTFTCPLSL